MMVKNITVLPLLAAAALLLCSATCRKTIDDSKDCQQVMCTMMFASVGVELKDAAGKPARLDSVQIRSDDGQMQSPAQQPSTGFVTIVDDSQRAVIYNKKVAVHLTAFKAGRVAAEQDFVVTADCCHVSKVSGPDSITIP